MPRIFFSSAFALGPLFFAAAALAQQVPYSPGPPLYPINPAHSVAVYQPNYAQPNYAQPIYAQPGAAARAAYYQQPVQRPVAAQPAYQPRPATDQQPYAPQPYAAPNQNRPYVQGQQRTTNAEGNRFQYGTLGADLRPNFETGIALGYRTGELKWNIAGNTNGQNPNVLSELTWDNLQMAEVSGGARYRVDTGAMRNFHIEGSAYYGYAVSGDNQDSDYELDDRNAEFSRSNNNAEGSSALGVKAAIGYEIPFIDQPRGWRFVGTPLIGYQYHQQRMRIQDGNQTLCNDAPSLGFDCTGIDLGPLGGLNSRYTAKWQGPFAALEAELGYAETHRLRLRGEYGYLSYDANARWNLRSDFRQDSSYTQEADGQGVTLSAEYRYGWALGTALTFSGEYSAFKATDGEDKTNFVDGSVGFTRLNEVTWDSQAYRIGLEQSF